MEAQTVFPSTPLYRPDQADRVQSDIKSLEAKLSNKYIEDKAEVQRQLRKVRQDFQAQIPVAPTSPDEEGRMVRRSKELLSLIKEGMPSMEEMRKAPSGAVDKHLSWEKRNKTRIAEWKHIMLRLTAGTGDRDAANLERHRPTVSTLGMDSAQIQGKQFFMPDTTSPSVVFSDEQIAILRALDPGLADRLSTMTNAHRAQVKEIVGIGLEAPSAASIAGKMGVERREAKKRTLSAEHKAKMAAGREAKRAGKA